MSDRLVTALAVVYFIGDPVTFVYLIMEDAKNTHGFFAWFVSIPVDFFLAMIWPIYWAVLHWLPMP